MKKNILIAAAVMILAQTAFAGKEDSFYIKANGGYSKLNKVHGFKSENAYFLGLGVGFYVLDNVRTDLVFDHFINTTHKGSRTRGGVKRNHKTKGKIESLTYNGYVDLFDMSVAKVFIGAGAGIAQVEAKNTFVNTVTNNTRSLKYKRNTNFTYALHTGVSLEAAPGVNAELSYSYRDFGKTKKNAVGRSVSYKGHHVGLGVRFGI
jgi:opacity protein-like surface antigen